MARRSRQNEVGVNTNRLFGLFAQKRGHHTENGSLQVDWNLFCSDLHDPAHDSTWQRLSQQIIQHHRSKYVPASTPLFDGKFKRSFNVAMAITVRALTIQGVSAAIIAKTQRSLCQHQLQHSKSDYEDRQIDSLVTESVPSSKHVRDSVLPIRSNSFPTLKKERKKQETISSLSTLRRQRSCVLPKSAAAMQLRPFVPGRSLLTRALA